MDKQRENGKKQWMKSKRTLIGGGIALVVIVAIVLICVLGKKEEAYRNIRVSEVIGTVTVKREGTESFEAYVNMNLMSGDEIVTEDHARLSLRLDDDKYVVLDENSKLTLHAAGTEEDSKTTLKLEYGAVFSDIKNKLSETSGYEVVTPASTMSVRGTQFEVVCREGQVKVLTYEGAVYVVPEGMKEGRTVSAGQWDMVIEAPDGTYGFDGETKTITAEDVGAFVSSYFEEAGIKMESIIEPIITPDGAVEPTMEPEATKAPGAELTKVPEVTKVPDTEPTVTQSVTEPPVLT